MGPLKPNQVEDDDNRQEAFFEEDGKEVGTAVWISYYPARASASNLLLCFFPVGEPTVPKQVHEHCDSKTTTRHITFASFEISSEARKSMQPSSSSSESVGPGEWSSARENSASSFSMSPGSPDLPSVSHGDARCSSSFCLWDVIRMAGGVDGSYDAPWKARFRSRCRTRSR
jgi:hypothetical protein